MKETLRNMWERLNEDDEVGDVRWCTIGECDGKPGSSYFPNVASFPEDPEVYLRHDFTDSCRSIPSVVLREVYGLKLPGGLPFFAWHLFNAHPIAWRRLEAKDAILVGWKGLIGGFGEQSIPVTNIELKGLAKEGESCISAFLDHFDRNLSHPVLDLVNTGCEIRGVRGKKSAPEGLDSYANACALLLDYHYGYEHSPCYIIVPCFWALKVRILHTQRDKVFCAYENIEKDPYFQREPYRNLLIFMATPQDLYPWDSVAYRKLKRIERRIVGADEILGKKKELIKIWKKYDRITERLLKEEKKSRKIDGKKPREIVSNLLESRKREEKIAEIREKLKKIVEEGVKMELMYYRDVMKFLRVLCDEKRVEVMDVLNGIKDRRF